jgi:membrane protease YdiL (CAAX protease family)
MSEGAQPAAASQGASAQRSPPGREGPYGPIPADARLTYSWAAPFAQVAIYVVSIVPAAIVAGLVTAPFFARGGMESWPQGELPPEIELPLYATLIVVQFPAWALLMIAWVRGFERRSLASIGLRGPGALRRYAIGLLAGCGVAVLLAGLSPLVVSAPPPEVFEPARILRADWILTMIAVTGVFLVQGACEEIAFRGWMTSAVAARRGLVAGVVVNTAVFAALHTQVFRQDQVEVGAVLLAVLVTITFAGWLGWRGLAGSVVVCGLALAAVPWNLTGEDMAVGAAGVAAIACVGVFLSLWAIAERSIAGVCGVHGAFNATLMLLGLFAAGATRPDASPGEALLETFKEATAQGDASVAGALLQLVVFAVLSALVWRRLRRGR